MNPLASSRVFILTIYLCTMQILVFLQQFVSLLNGHLIVAIIEVIQGKTERMDNIVNIRSHYTLLKSSAIDTAFMMTESLFHVSVKQYNQVCPRAPSHICPVSSEDAPCDTHTHTPTHRQLAAKFNCTRQFIVVMSILSSKLDTFMTCDN